MVRDTFRQAGRYLIGAFIALAVDVTLVTVSVSWAWPIMAARLLGLLAGITTTYFFNRRFTFAPQQAAGLADWVQYVLRQSLGSALNFVVSSALIYGSDRLVWQIWGAIFVGAVVGFFVNFFSARRQLHTR